MLLVLVEEQWDLLLVQISVQLDLPLVLLELWEWAHLEIYQPLDRLQRVMLLEEEEVLLQS